MALLLDPGPGRMAGGRRSAVWAGRLGAQRPVWNDAELRLHFRPESFFATDGRGRHILLNMAINAQDSVAMSANGAQADDRNPIVQALHEMAEIGRAAGRGSVCKYVSLSVGDVSSQQKTDRT